MKNRYLDFLCKIVGRTYEYSKLLARLHEIEFYSLVPNDDNRGADGEHLRQQFIDEGGLHRPSSLPVGSCTVLEMLIGLAFRMEFDLMGGQYERTAAEWFWVLIDNLGFNAYDDHILTARPELGNELEQNLEILLERRYCEDGDGGLFPLKWPKNDQRKVEIWYQMSAWIIENYPV